MRIGTVFPLAALVTVFSLDCAVLRHPASVVPPTEARTEPPVAAPPPTVSTEAETPDGIFHVVKKGQTLWRIATTYGVPLQEIVGVNGIVDPNRIDTGQALFVPRATALIDVPPAPAPPPLRGTPAEGAVVSEGSFGWPVSGGAILSHFDDPRRHHRHRGLDIRGCSGQEIVAARAGRVVYSGNTLKGYGNMVILDHGDGIQTLYAHGKALLVQVGDQVERGQPIARIGRTGNATTEHCHFEIRKYKLPVDPLPFLTTVAQVLP